jgi:GNAT superfamily N-acetyltransferase
MSNKLIIDSAYCDRISLKTGESVCLRLVRASDKQRMVRAFAELSQPSRHKRFFGAKQALSDSDLRYFTETDNWDHFALGAVVVDENNRQGDGLGVARCIRLPDDPSCAEVAITVIDRMQGQGIGRALLEQLVTAALERGITRFRFECLAHNLEMQRLVKSVGRIVSWSGDGETLVVETDLPKPLPAALTSTNPQQSLNFYGLFRTMAIRSVDLHMRLSRSAMKQTMRASFIGADLLKRAKLPRAPKRH